DHFARFGYQRVKPPLVEFETGLLDGVGAAVAEQTFRIMDPVSQRMMGLRADITPQIARIAATRLAAEPRPLRLCYAGEVLRVRGGQLREDRQFRQIGVELIGPAHAGTADAEVILLAAEALAGIGIEGLSVDINVPDLAGTVCDSFGLGDDARARVLAAIDRKDAAALAKAAANGANDELARVLGRLLSVDCSIDGLAEAPARLVERLTEVVDLVHSSAPDLTLTVDPLERRGFEYHSGISFTLYALGARTELGFGGRYITAGGEPATGFTLLGDALLGSAPQPTARDRLFMPYEAPATAAASARAEGWQTVKGLVAARDSDVAEARRLSCTHIWQDGAIKPLAEDD
ncbi:MAG: ATP phosphoribosyltransferase regulatory subunit, partial [Alphaproteobacteria bacterium]|nr:ATP phosphoribosyltransferase regulatory subunit [Alphaproteobacteria bacterium]